MYPRTLNPDDDVLREAALVHQNQGRDDDYKVVVENLFKVYGNGFPAVGGNTFAIKQNEVLGLLGPNGAGKSSTF